MIETLSSELAEVLAMAALIAVAYVALRRWFRGSVFDRRTPSKGFFWMLTAVLLVKLTEDVVGNETADADRQLLQWIHARAPASWEGALQAVTDTASFRAITVFLLIAAAVALWRKRRRDAAALALTPALAGVVIYLAKGAVHRSRPALWEVDAYWGTSFPSGHTLAAAAFATALGLQAGSLRHRGRRVLVRTALFAWVALVAFSRMYLGVHWPTDVAAAACAGALVAIAVHGAVARFWPTGARRSTVFGGLNGPEERP